MYRQAPGHVAGSALLPKPFLRSPKDIEGTYLDLAVPCGVSDAPIELIAVVDDDGRMSARREGEPSFTGVQGVADAIMSALSRGVDLVVPGALFEENRSDFPPELPPYIKIR